ncbi:cupin domain-containing protein [Castellaniella ginsengisoli]|uniref:Cupin domain-containing protein n=1 Tax=Castellaniella ginsengisoli TaxID=546114 RepID=A0AB39CQ51_9BURK
MADARPARGAGASGGSEAWRSLVTALGLQPHPEGGYYREVFRSGLQVPFLGAPRSAGTSIYYLLAQGACSAWHRIDADETWYFHAGGPLALHVLSPEGGLVTHRLGDPMRHDGAVFQAVVSAGCWFAAELIRPDDFVLVGCAVAPGFEFSGFQLAAEADLADAVGRHGDWVRRLLKPAG